MANVAHPELGQVAAAQLGVQTQIEQRPLARAMFHRLRAVRLTQWRHGTILFCELRALGATADLAARIAGNARSWWRNSRMGLNRVMPVAHFDRLGVRKFS